MQAYIVGPHHSQALVALRGEPLASFGWERFVATVPVKGQTSVVRFVRSPDTGAISEVLCRGLGINGFFNVQFVIDAASGVPYMLEINRRVVTHMHLGERVGRDLPSALLRALEGLPAEAPTAAMEDASGALVVFPREWLRDPHSRHLTELPVDCPGTTPNSSKRWWRCGTRSDRTAPTAHFCKRHHRATFRTGQGRNLPRVPHDPSLA